jgi:hypothetical protein
MIIVLSVAGIGVLLAGLVAIGFGIEVKEFSLGNTLILAGVVAACSGLIMLSLAVLVRELRAIVWRFGTTDQPVAARGRGERPPSVFADPGPGDEPAAVGPLFLRDQPALEAAAAAPTWQEDVPRDRARPRGAVPPAPAAESVPEPKPRRDLMFSSSSRKERAGARVPDPVATDLDLALPAAPMSTPLPPPETGPPTPFEDAWPPPDPLRSDPYRRSVRRASTLNSGASAAADDRPQVTILKSGVVDGMAYSLYSDGSIEAQMPEGMMRFGSIGELRAHLDQRS